MAFDRGRAARAEIEAENSVTGDLYAFLDEEPPPVPPTRSRRSDPGPVGSARRASPRRHTESLDGPLLSHAPLEDLFVFTPSCKANDCKAEEASAKYPELYEWKEDRGSGPSVPRLEDPCDSFAAMQKRHAPMTHAATLHPLSKTKPWDKDKTMSTKHSMPSSEYMGPIDSGSSNM
eukprot:s39_g14.t1